MAIEKNSILVDASLNLTGVSDASIKNVKRMIKDTILTNNEIKLNFDKNGQSALLKKLDVVYDKVNDIKRIAASVDIGDTKYKVFIDDYSKRRQGVISLNREISGQEKQINTLRSKGYTDDSAKIKKITEDLNKSIEKRNALATGMLKNESLTGSDKYKASNLISASVTKTTGSTKPGDVALLNKQYEEQAYLIKTIASARAQSADIEADTLTKRLDALKTDTEATEKRIKLNNTEVASQKIINDAQSKTKKSEDFANVSEESSAYKDRISALNNYRRTLKQIENDERSLAFAQQKYDASMRNQTAQAKASIEQKKQEIAALRSEAEEYKTATNIRSKNDTRLGNTNEYNTALKEEENSLKRVKIAQNEASAAFAKSNNLIGILSENFKAAAARIIDYTLVYRSLWAVMQKVEQAISTITELNKAFTDIQMVTGYTSDQIKELESTYSGMAKSMGATVQQVAEGATEWLRQGKTVAETNELLRQSMILSKTGAIDSATATERLTSTLNGYKMSVQDASRIVDVFSKLDMITASSVDELSVAFTKTANSAKDAGIPFENLAGLIATVSEVTRKSATTIGESYKTLAARYMNVKIGKFVDDETGEAINDTEKVLNKLGIQLRTSTNEWRDMWDVMSEIGAKWDTYTDMEKNAIVVSQAGVRQAENLRATYNNWDKVLEYTAEAYDSAGFAAEKYGIYLDNIEGRTNKMIATYQDMVSNPVFENLVKNIISAVTNFGELIDKIGLVNIVFVAFSAALGMLGKMVLTSLVAKVGVFTRGIAVLATGMSGLPAMIINITKSMMGFSTVLTASEASLAAFGAAFAPIAIAAGITAITYAVLNYKNATEKAAEKVKELTNEIEALNGEYDQLKSKATLTADEKQRLALLEAELKIKQEQIEAEKKLQAQLILNDLTKSKTMVGRGGRTYAVEGNKLDDYNKKLLETVKLQDKANSLSEQMASSGGTAKGFAALEEMNSELTNNKSELMEIYKELLPVKELYGKDLPVNVASFINSLERILGVNSSIQASTQEAENTIIAAFGEEWQASEQLFNNIIKGNADVWNIVKEAYGVDVENFKTVADAKVKINGFLIQKLGANWAEFYGSQEEALQAMINAANSMPTNDLISRQMGSDAIEAQRQLDALNKMTTAMENAANVRLQSAGIDTTGAGGSSSKTPIDPQDMAAAFIKAANAESELTKKQEESLKRQIKQAEKAKDFAKQIELQNELLNNQKLQITQIAEANLKIHGEADRLRSSSSYGNASNGWFDANGEATAEYIKLLESFAGKTDDVSKAQYKAITDLFNNLYKLKQGWNANTQAVYELNDAINSTQQTIDDFAKESAQTIADLEEEIVKMYEWEKEEKLDKAEKAKDKALKEAEDEYNKKKKLYEDELSDYQKMIQGKLDALQEESDKENFDSSLSDIQKEIDDLQKQKNELLLAAGSGDRVAQQQLEAIQEQLDEKQQEKDKLISDRNRSLEENALNDSLDSYEEYIQDKQDSLEDSYQKEQDKIEETYQKKVKRLEDEYSKEELYSKARKALISGEYDEITEIFEKYKKDQGEGWSELGGILEDEFVSRLREAVDLLFTLEEYGVSTGRIIDAIDAGDHGNGGSGGGSGGGGSSQKSHTTLGGGFSKMTTSDWGIYKQNKWVYEKDEDADEEDRAYVSRSNAQLRAKYGIAKDTYTYDDIKDYYASGTKSATGGISVVGEKGPELRMLNQGDGIIPSDLTSTLMSFAQNPASYVSKLLYNITPSFNATSNPLTIGSLITIEGDVTDMDKVDEIKVAAQDSVSQIYKLLKQSNKNVGFGW